MATEFDYKSKLLESIIESLQCFNCKDVPGFMKDQRNRYSCFEKSHQLCENCKGTFLSENTDFFVISNFKLMNIFLPCN